MAMADDASQSKSQTAPPPLPPKKRTRRLPQNPTHTLNGVGDSNTNYRPFINLPDDVIENIFTFLPIKNAVQIGVLSTRFKTSWLFNRKLLFDREFARNRTRPEFISIVDRVFASHSGSKIQCLRLYFDPTGSYLMVLDWIQMSIDKGVEELDLHFVQSQHPFKLPSSFVDVETVRKLKLWYCEIDLPPKLTGLRFLSSVILRRVVVSSRIIETLIHHCTLLETLDLTECNGILQLNIVARNLKRFKVLKVGDCWNIVSIDIDSPTLRSLYYCGPVRALKIANALQLNDVILNFTPSRGFIRNFLVENLVFDLSRITLLTTTSKFLEGLTARIRDGTFGNLKFCLSNLEEFQLFMEGASYCNLCDIAFFLGNCPRIEKLFIDLNEFSFECGLYWELHQKQLVDNYFVFFPCLKFVKVKGFKFQKHELEMVRYFLKKALLLETFVLVFPKNGRVNIFQPDVPIYNSLFLSWKVSPFANIFIYEHSNDKTPIHPKHSNIWF